MTGLTISNLVLWVLQISTIIVVVGLARQVGVLHLRVRPLGAGQTEDGPSIGASVDLEPVLSFRGNEMPVVMPGYLSLVTFASPKCGACGPTMQAVRRVAGVERDVRVVVAVDGEKAEGLKYAQGYGFADAVSSDNLRQLASKSRPFAVVVSSEGGVLGVGVPNTLEQLEGLLASARRVYAVLSRPAADGMDEHIGPLEPDGPIAMTELSLMDIRARAHGTTGEGRGNHAQ